MAQDSKLKHDFLGLESLYNDRYPNLIVPDFQRGFDWNQDHVEDLWEDLHYYVDKVIDNDEEEFFCGTIILKTPDNEKASIEEKDRYQIVDGQQRLTSFYLLAIVLREKFKEFDTDKKRDVDKGIINNYDFRDKGSPKFLGTKKIRKVLEYISSNKWDGEFPDKKQVDFKDGRALAPINKKLKECLKSHQDEIEGRGSRELPYDFERIRALWIVIRRLKLVVLEVATDERAFYLFETTNARGKELGPGDLLKNHLFSKSPEEDRDAIYDEWEGVIHNSSGKLIIMLRHFYYVHEKHVSQKQLYRSLKKLCDKIGPQQLLEQIRDYSEFHYLMHDKGTTREMFLDYLTDLEIFDRKPDDDLIDLIYLSVSALRFFRSALTYPVLYAFLKRFSYLLRNDESLNDQDNRSSFRRELKTIFKAFENFQFVNYKICSNKGNKIEIPYSRFAASLNNSKTALEFLGNLEKLYKFFRDEINSEENFAENFKQISYEDERPLIHYIFQKIEMNRFKNENKKNKDKALQLPIFPWFKTIKWDIDHWMPKNIASDASVDHKEIWDEIINYPHDNNLIHNIGNLSVMHNKLNSKLSNKMPSDKIEFIDNTYNPTNYNYTKSLDDFRLDPEGSWGVEDIVKRAEILAREFYVDISAIGEESANFPSVSSEKLEKFK
ncbi:MAG: DUF262 domain-containing protein [Gammaproteobacteria bacterium]